MHFLCDYFGAGWPGQTSSPLPATGGPYPRHLLDSLGKEEPGQPPCQVMGPVSQEAKNEVMLRGPGGMVQSAHACVYLVWQTSIDIQL